MNPPDLTSAKNEAADNHRSDHSRRIRNQTRRYRMARALHTDRAEVNGNDVKRRLRAAVDRSRHADDEVIGTELFHQIAEQRQGPAPAQRSHQRHRHQLGGKWTRLRAGFSRFVSKSIPPEPRNMPMATSMATRYGMMRTAKLKPSFAPSTNSS